ncbi:SDR family NAD(P)-dependent oxidoreductase [Chloroflexota bacterium]
MLLDGKVAVITGSASGIGRASAILFAAEGARVVVSDIDEKEGLEVVRTIKEAGNEATFCHTDIAVVSEVERLVKTAVKMYNKLDIYWHNAGIAGPGLIEDTTEEGFDWQLAVHLKAGFFGAKFVIPEIINAGGGSILFTGSGCSALKPNPFSPSYSAAKAGLVVLVKCLALSLSRKNVRVNCICPGVVKTSLSHKFSQRGPEYTGGLDRIAEQSPLGRYITADEVAQAALFLVSDKASAITGVALPVDGGVAAT